MGLVRVDRLGEDTHRIEPVVSVSTDALGAPTHGQHARFGNRGTLHYNQTYRKGKHVYSAINLRPDYVWERPDGQRIVMDAKFRLDNLQDLVASGDDDVPAVTAKAKDADLQKMHTYRDAINGVTEAIVLYPGSESAFWQSNGASTGTLTISDVIEGNLEGIGAIPVRPMTVKSSEEQGQEEGLQ